MKKLISVLLAVLMIAGCMAISFSASAEAEMIAVTNVTEPKIGEAPTTSGIKATDGWSVIDAKYYVKEQSLDSWDPSFSVFEADREYMITITVEYNMGVEFSSVEATVNSKAASKITKIGLAKYEIQYVFDKLTAPADPEPTAPVCAWCGGDHSNGFFQMIIGWFHGILASLFGAKY
ncbi:MAG: hypothetical protein IKN72_00700 [Clostridia bacterium]|nr:hypothetical protein [Clostridia bacterium]